VIQLTHQAIDPTAALQLVGSPAAGATVLFLGTTRQFSAGRETVTLRYEGYEPMAERKLAELEAEARRQWPIEQAILIHRLGEVGLSEASVLVAVSAAHRDAAFAAAQWLMDRLKQDVPIWKQEQWADGTREWQHPRPAADPLGSPRPSSCSEN